MRVLALSSYPIEAAATRFRLMMYTDGLREAGVDVDVSPFLSSEAFKVMYSGGNVPRKIWSVIPGLARRFSEVVSAGKYDALFIQRESMFFGPAFFEWLLNSVRGLPIVLDLDDATYVPYTSPTYGRLANSLKFFGKTDRLIKRASVVLCGNRFIAEHVESKGTRAVIVPTTVDPEVFKPKDRVNNPMVVGWIGTHSTFPLLESVFPILSDLAKKHRFVLRVIGSGRSVVEVPGVEVENVEWRLETEPDDFAALDVGLYPITTSSSASEEWLKGKSGFKAIQYLASGVPFIMTPLGVCAEIGEHGRTHLSARSTAEWSNSLDRILSDRAFRAQLGSQGRAEFLSKYHPAENLRTIISVLKTLD